MQFNDNLRPKGGRGCRAGYEKTHVRVPKVFKDRVVAYIDALYVEEFELSVEEDRDKLTPKAIEKLEAINTHQETETSKPVTDSCISINREDFENLLRKVKRSKKSGSKSLTALARLLLDEPDFEITGK